MCAGNMAGQCETPLTNPYITALDEGKTDRGKLLGALFRRVVQQRRILSLNHRKLITEKRPSASNRTSTVRSVSSFPVPAQSRPHILETSMSSEGSEQGEEVLPVRQVEQDTAAVEVPCILTISKCDIAINSTFDADVPYLLPRPPRLPAHPKSAYPRHHLSQCKAVQLTLEIDSKRESKGVSPWSKSKTRVKSVTRYSEDDLKGEGKAKSLSMQISPQLRRKQAADRLQHTRAAARVLRLYTKMETWRQNSPARPLPPSVFAPNTHWPAKASALRVFR